MLATRIQVELDEEVLRRVIEELELSNPPDFTLNHSGKFPKSFFGEEHKNVRGSYEPATNHVTITSQGESFEREGLYVLTKHIRFTVLHELRHAWQREHWTAEEKREAARGSYRERKEEIDANKWAAYASPLYAKLVTIKRTTVGNRRRPPG